MGRIESFRLCSSFYSMNTFYNSKIYSLKYHKRNITKIFFIPADSGKNYFIATIFLCVLYYSYFISFFCQKYNWCNNYFNGKKLMNNIFINLRNKNKSSYNFLSRTISFRFSSLALTRPNKIFLFSLLLFNLGGSPPMVGFLLKLISLKFFIEFGGNSSIRISINISFNFKNIYFTQLLGLGSLPTFS